jgi:arylsulfatase A-like enzyme
MTALEKLNAPRKPNVIIILADDLGYGDLGCYGQKRIQTPNIDRLAAEGKRFTQFYAGSTVCAPSRAVLMTGRHSGHVSIRGNAAVPLATNETTLAEMLKQANYQTGLVGKWGLGLADTGATPTRRGFDDFVGYLSQTHAHDYYPTQLYRNDRIFTLPQNEGGKQGRYSHDFFTMAASNYVRVAKYQPFFLYLAYTLPHAQNELKDQGMPVPSAGQYATNDWPAMERNKAAMITRLDDSVGLLLAQLRQLRLETNTVIFFTSDNGPHKEGGVDPEFFNSSGPLRGIKRDLTEGGIRVPFIAWWPGTIAPAVITNEVFTFWDLMPTIADVTQVKASADIDGLSFLPTLLGKGQTNRHEFLYWEFHERGSKQAVRMGDWKAIRLAPGAPLELYDLKTDLGEKRNVAAEHTEVVAKIDEHLKNARTPSDYWPMQSLEEWQAQQKKKRANQEPVN